VLCKRYHYLDRGRLEFFRVLHGGRRATPTDLAIADDSDRGRLRQVAPHIAHAARSQAVKLQA
jgi:hypothetical protein